MDDHDEAEGIEARAWEDMFRAVPPLLAQGAGFSNARIGGLVAFAIRAAPTIQFNRAQASGEGAMTEADAEATVAHLRRNASPAWALQLREGAYEAPLRRLGLEPRGSWTKFTRATDAPLEARTDLRIEAVGPDRAKTFASVVQQAFEAPPPFAAWIAALVGRPGWTTYVALDGEAPVAAAALWLDRAGGWLGLGCTLPSARRRGAQGALLARRVSDAGAAGARSVWTETGTPAEGDLDRHTSYRNILRAGFEPIHRRTNWRPA